MKKLCAICGENEATTKDHIPPKSLYPKPRPNGINLNTVPACSKCNNGDHLIDEEFKVVINLSTGEFRDNSTDVLDTTARTVGNNHRIAEQIFASQRDVFTYLRGPILEPAVAITMNGENYCKVVQRIVRGLYWMNTGKALDKNAIITVLGEGNLDPKTIKDLMDIMKSLEATYLNQKTFVYKFFLDDDGSGIWGLQFFKKHTVFAVIDTMPPKDPT